MLKKILRDAMTDTTTLYRDMLAREMRGPSDSEGAMHRLQVKFGLDYWQQWALRYRSPKRIAYDLVHKIQSAHMAMLEQSVRRDLSLLQIELAKGTADADIESLVAEAENILAKIAKKKGLK